MMTIRHVAVLLSGLLGGGLATCAQPAPRVAASAPASPDSALVRLTAPQVTADTMQRLGRGVRWRYRPGQPAGWAAPATDDAAWPLVIVSFPFGQGPPGWRGTGCFRLRFTLDSALLGQPLGFRFRHAGASEIYLDGQLLGRLGTVGTSQANTTGWWPSYQPLPFMLREAGPHLLAVHYARFDPWPANEPDGFVVRVAPSPRLIAESLTILRLADVNLIVMAGTAVLMLLHLFLFLHYRPQRANLYCSLYMAALCATGWFRYSSFVQNEMLVRFWCNVGFEANLALASVMLVAFTYAICQRPVPWRWLLLLGGGWLGAVAWYAGHPLWPIRRVIDALFGLSFLNMFWVLGGALRRRQPGIWLVALGALCTSLVYVFTGSDVFQQRSNDVALAYDLGVQVGLLVLPGCLSLYLARDFAVTRRSLEAQLHQVQELSAQTRRQEAERQQLMRTQNERLESTVRARTEEISAQNHTLAAQRDEISAQADQLRTLDEVKTRFFTNITHEFRTPLTLMLGPAAQIAADTREPGTRQQAALVQRNAQRLLHLINQLLDLSRLEAGQQVPHPAPGEVVGFVRGVVGSFASLAQQRGVACSFEADPPALLVDFDADLLEKVLANLLGNAFKFTPSGGAVTVQLRAEASPELPNSTWVALTVSDTGCGIAPAQLPHVFDRFYQADHSPTREHEGSGIGLALTKELVELHGGTIALTSELGCGTTAVVRLPLAVASGAPAAAAAGGPVEAVAPPPRPAAGPLAAPPPEAPLLLVIEDNADVRAYLSTLLAAHYQLLTAENGAAGVALAVEYLPDLVLTDAMMPRLDGYGVCRALKQDERTSHIPIVMLTAKTDLSSKLQSLDIGADAYLTKPFRHAELLAQLRNLVRGREQLQEAYRRGMASPPPSLPSIEQIFLTRVRQVITQFLDDETLSVESLSRELSLSRTQLHRKLKALTDLAPGDFIRLVRLQRAHELLAGGAGTVSEVAYQVGYGNPASFSTSFSRHFGYAPSNTPRHVKQSS